jgi:hypothetical protein
MHAQGCPARARMFQCRCPEQAPQRGGPHALLRSCPVAHPAILAHHCGYHCPLCLQAVLHEGEAA